VYVVNILGMFASGTVALWKEETEVLTSVVDGIRQGHVTIGVENK